MFVVSVVCCQVEVSTTGRSLVQRSLTECVVSECDSEESVMIRPLPPGAVASWVENYDPLPYFTLLRLIGVWRAVL